MRRLKVLNSLRTIIKKAGFFDYKWKRHTPSGHKRFYLRPNGLDTSKSYRNTVKPLLRRHTPFPACGTASPAKAPGRAVRLAWRHRT